jgi:ankyrin repeat protein
VFAVLILLLYLLMGTQHGMSALHFAANAGHLEVVKVLLAAKANIHALDEVLIVLCCCCTPNSIATDCNLLTSGISSTVFHVP